MTTHLPQRLRAASGFAASIGLVAALVSLLAGCAITKIDPPPPVAAAAQYKEAGEWQRAPVGTPVPDEWWTMFNDPVLDDLEQRLVIGNENLKASVAAVSAARAAYAASRAALLPTVSAGLGATRSGTPSGDSTINGASGGNGRTATSISFSGTASWELDLWGRLALARTGAEASLQASADDLAAARLSARALLATTYFSMRSSEAQVALLVRSVEGYRRSLDLTQARYDSGVAARTDVLQAQTQLKSALAQVADGNAQRAQLEHAIAVLLGLQPAAFGIARTDVLPAPPAVPQMLPAALLQRRPDIAAAERRLALAYAQIGIADAAFFPDLTLSASAGYRSSSVTRLLSAPSFFWSIGPSLTEAILDGGQRRFASAQARATAVQATSTYRQAVLTALQEVEDNLVLADQLQQEAALQGEALQAARQNLEITLDQYRGGTVSYLNVVIAQTAALNSESTLLSVQNRQLAATNQLLKNIAGRWEPASP